MQAIRDISPFRDNDAALLNASLASYTQIQEQNKHIDENLVNKALAYVPDLHMRLMC